MDDSIANVRHFDHIHFPPFSEEGGSILTQGGCEAIVLHALTTTDRSVKHYSFVRRPIVVHTTDHYCYKSRPSANSARKGSSESSYEYGYTPSSGVEFALPLIATQVALLRGKSLSPP